MCERSPDLVQESVRNEKLNRVVPATQNESRQLPVIPLEYSNKEFCSTCELWVDPSELIGVGCGAWRCPYKYQ